VKSSAGATERTRIAEVANLLKTIDALRERGLRVWGASAAVGHAPPVDAVDFREDSQILSRASNQAEPVAATRRDGAEGPASWTAIQGV